MPKQPAAEQPGNQGRDLWQHVKVTPSERAAWKAAAQAEGVTVADLIRKRMGTAPEGRAPKRTRAEGADAVQVLAALVSIDQALTSFSYRPEPDPGAAGAAPGARAAPGLCARSVNLPHQCFT